MLTVIISIYFLISAFMIISYLGQSVIYRKDLYQNDIRNVIFLLVLGPIVGLLVGIFAGLFALVDMLIEGREGSPHLKSWRN